jgi:hypothetical protein
MIFLHFPCLFCCFLQHYFDRFVLSFIALSSDMAKRGEFMKNITVPFPKPPSLLSYVLSLILVVFSVVRPFSSLRSSVMALLKKRMVILRLLRQEVLMLERFIE